MPNNMEDIRIRIFRMVAETGSFTRTAKRMGITQPSVSQNISELEKTLGTALFRRERRHVMLTEAGEAFYRYSGHIQYWYDAVNRVFGKDSKSGSDELSISVPDFLAGQVLSTALTEYRLMSPGVMLKISSRNDADITFIPVAESYFDSINKETSSWKSADADPGYLNSDELAAHETMVRIPAAVVIRASSSSDLNERDAAVFEPYSGKLPERLESGISIISSNAELLKETALISDAIAVLPRCMVGKELRNGTLTDVTDRLMTLQDIGSLTLYYKILCKEKPSVKPLMSILSTHLDIISSGGII